MASRYFALQRVLPQTRSLRTIEKTILYGSNSILHSQCRRYHHNLQQQQQQQQQHDDSAGQNEVQYNVELTDDEKKSIRKEFRKGAIIGDRGTLIGDLLHGLDMSSHRSTAPPSPTVESDFREGEIDREELIDHFRDRARAAGAYAKAKAAQYEMQRKQFFAGRSDLYRNAHKTLSLMFFTTMMAILIFYILVGEEVPGSVKYAREETNRLINTYEGPLTAWSVSNYEKKPQRGFYETESLDLEHFGTMKETARLECEDYSLRWHISLMNGKVEQLENELLKRKQRIADRYGLGSVEEVDAMLAYMSSIPSNEEIKPVKPCVVSSAVDEKR